MNEDEEKPRGHATARHGTPCYARLPRTGLLPLVDGRIGLLSQTCKVRAATDNHIFQERAASINTHTNSVCGYRRMCPRRLEGKRGRQNAEGNTPGEEAHTIKKKRKKNYEKGHFSRRKKSSKRFKRRRGFWTAIEKTLQKGSKKMNTKR